MSLKLCLYAQVATGVYFWPCKRGFKKLHPGANLHALGWCTRLHPGASEFVHMNAKCLISLCFNREFRYIAELFYYDPI